jgi:hypothetical protein
VPTLEEIQQQLGRYGVHKKLLGPNVVNLLLSFLKDDEEIQYACRGNLMQPPSFSVIIVVVTDRNLIQLNPKTLAYTVTPLDSIESIRLKTSVLIKLTIQTLGKLTEIDIADAKQARSIANLIHLAIGCTEPLVDENKNIGKPFPKWRVTLLVILIPLMYIHFNKGSNEPDAQIQKATTSALSEDELTSCFISGESAATVYISDMAKYANSGLMPSTVMEKGCERKGNETANPKACIDSCEMGFRKVAKDVLNGR